MNLATPVVYVNRGRTVALAAIVTAVHSEDCVNLHVIQDDQHQPLHKTSVMRRDQFNQDAGDYFTERDTFNAEEDLIPPYEVEEHSLPNSAADDQNQSSSGPGEGEPHAGDPVDATPAKKKSKKKAKK